MKDEAKAQCPCCDYWTLLEPSAYEICDVCGWEDDFVQKENPNFDGGANDLSLIQARNLWRIKMAKEQTHNKLK